MKIRLFAVLVIALLSLSLLTGCVTGNAQAPTPTDPPVETAPVPKLLTPEEAEAIAFNHAGIKAGTISRMRTELDYDSGIAEYDIQFVSEGFEYDYEIHAETGAILRREMEPVDKPLPTESPATEPPVTEATAPKSTTSTKTDRITKTEAQNIALKDAGLTNDQVRGLKAELDYDNGIAEYDVEFSCNGWEYDYEINAETGRILSREKDRDD